MPLGEAAAKQRQKCGSHFWRAALVAAACASACGGNRVAPPAAPEAAPPSFRLAPASDLVAAAGLEWLVLARPREIAARADLIPAIHMFASEEKLASFAAKNGGVDLRSIDELAIAHYTETTLYIVRTRVDPGRVEASFNAHLGTTLGRAIERKGNLADQLVRIWGDAADGPEELAIFGTSGVALERGKAGPLRAAEAFAENKLKRASPALRAIPLSSAAEAVDDAPLRFFAPGPFRGEWSKGLAGLLAATTAVAISVQFPTTPPPATAPKPSAPMAVRVALLGAWGDDAPAAAERLASAFDTLARSSLGHLCGLGTPLVAARTQASPGAVSVDVTVDALEIARGIHIAMEAQVDEIMEFGKNRPRAPLTPAPKQ